MKIICTYSQTTCEYMIESDDCVSDIDTGEYNDDDLYKNHNLIEGTKSYLIY